MMLAAAYIAVNKARGARDGRRERSVLPDLSVAAPMPEDTVTLRRAEMMAEAIKQRRGMYQSGLLKLLKDATWSRRARYAQRHPRHRTLQVTVADAFLSGFAAAVFFDAVAANPAESDRLRSTVRQDRSADQDVDRGRAESPRKVVPPISCS